jgi:integrase
VARTVKDTSLESRAARTRLKPRQEPYWRAIDAGAHLGYYRGRRGGSWLARLYADGRYHKHALGIADDVSDPDGLGVLSFSQAQGAARAFFERKRRELAGLEPAQAGPYKVSNAIADYLKHYRRTGKAVVSTEDAINAHILPALGDIEVARLSKAKIEEWKQGLAEAPARLRKRKTATEQRFKAKPKTNDQKRQRRATANRILTILKAALNYAWKAGKVASDDPWRKVSPFKGVDAPVIRYLDEAECVRLVNASAADFRHLARGALFTGCRFGELIVMLVSAFNPDSGTVIVRESKSGKPRHVTLTVEGQKFFAAACAGKPSDALILTRADGSPWGTNHQQRPLKAACKFAKIKPAISFHVLRHTHGSILAMKGVPMPVIAKQLGHADTRMTEKHYAHLSPNYVAETIRASFPTLGIGEVSNVQTIKPQSTHKVSKRGSS